MVVALLGQRCFRFSILDHSDQVSSQEKDTSSNNSNSPRFIQLTSQTTALNSEKLDICKEEQASCEWTEYDDFPSSEDLSAFLADLEMDSLNKTKEKSQPITNSKKSSRPKPCVTSEEKTPNEMVTSQTVSFSDVVYGFVQENYTEFTDFPSSEDLDAFLADMELDCETILQKTTLAPADVMRSADAFDLHQKVEVSKTLAASNEHNIKDFAKRNNTEHSDIVLNLTDCDGFYTQQDSVTQRCFAKSDSIVNKIVSDIDLSDSELLRNCENIFTLSSEKSIPKNVVTRSKQKRHSSVNLHKRFMKNNKPTHCQEEIIKQGKVVCGLESTEELREEKVVCTTSLKHEGLNKWSHDQRKNETEIHQTGSQETTSHDQGNSFSLAADDMLNYSFEMMHTSHELFSQSLSRTKGVCPYTPGLYSSSILLEGKSRSWCSKHLSGTPELFSSPGCSPSRREMNSVSLFSYSNHSLFSSSSSPLCLVKKPASSSDSNRNEPDASSIINHLESEKKCVQSDLQTISLHSTPYHSNYPSKRFHRMCTPAGVSPLLSDSRGPSPYNEPEISALGTPVVFSQMSTSSL